jgi:FkbM family methyltransferase
MIKKLIQGSLGLFDLRLFRPKKTQQEKDKWLVNLGVRTVIDIGANTGQFAQHLMGLFPESRIYSFEPLADCYAELVKTFAGAPRFRAFKFALGDKKEEREIEHNEFSPSSSFLPMAEAHKVAFPFTRKTHRETVQVVRLDDLAAELEIRKPLLVKMDVQGFEDKVISGGTDTIKKADIIVIEVSMISLYEGQPLFADINKMLTELGFQYRGNWEQGISPIDGQILQADAIFMKPEPAKILTR